VLDRVWVMPIGRFKKFLEVVFGWSSLPLEITFDSRYEPLTGVVDLYPTIVVARSYSKAMWSALLSLLATLSAFPGTFDGCLGGHSPASTSSPSRVT
jgi:hypothetical protein